MGRLALKLHLPCETRPRAKRNEGVLVRLA